MPVYEYECGSCRHRFEKKQGFHDEAESRLPEVRGKGPERLIRASPVIFKGSGFYVTDHRPPRTEGVGERAGKERKQGGAAGR